MLKYKENSGDLWRTQKVVEAMTGVFRSLTQSLRLLADRIEAQTGLTSEQRAIIEREISDKAIEMLRKRLIEDFELYNGFKDKEQLADIKIDDIGLEEEEDA